MIEIDETREVRAPAAVVWQVITDFDRYPEWNPFVERCRSSLAPGDPIDMRVHVFEGFAQAQRETIFEHRPGERLVYGLAPARLGALASRRVHEVTPQGDDASRYRSHFVLSGWLSPLTGLLLGSRLERGFRAMTAALVARAEALAAESRTPPRVEAARP